MDDNCVFVKQEEEETDEGPSAAAAVFYDDDKLERQVELITSYTIWKQIGIDFNLNVNEVE